MRARLALFEAAGFLALRLRRASARPGAARRPLTGSYTLAALTGQLTGSGPVDDGRGGGGAVADDHFVATRSPTPANGAAWPSSRPWRPLRSVESLAGPLSQLGAPLADDAATRAWLAALPGPAATAGLARRRPGHGGRAAGHAAGAPIELGPAYVAAALWRLHGYGRGCALPFWAAPVSRIDALARHGGGEIELGYLDCVAEAAMRGARELDRLLAAARRIAELPGSARSRLPAAGAVALQRAARHRTPARPSARCFDARRSGGRSPSLEEGSLTGKGRSRARSTSAAGKIGFRWPVGHPDAKSSRKIVAPWQLEPDCCIASL